MDTRTSQLLPNTVFHIYNRGINGAPIFFEKRNYYYFLQQYAKYVDPFVETYAYCLMNNHFHLMIRVKPEEHLESVIKTGTEKPNYWHISNGISSFLQSYTRAINKVYDRTGPLFDPKFKRIAVEEESYFSQLIAYIHTNPTKHGFVKDFKDFAYSSYHTHLSSKKTKLQREQVIDWFGSPEAYIRFHTDQNFETLEDHFHLELSGYFE
ncbi:hypothetical protein [Reichenbachiella ulvae]|uniref:Transposase IS200-like domain-containing protein n=1 Tax=Reichenbachiella ulvae TaxID=2980104 RepID=A0ABT3CPH9_9BACT|nr:hypothetical protein [Reichenbachiella ulvae]MCV9385522.1 hypothetical protein [Reichenbachiella ulvae]